jgi:hypothetical protein
VAAFSSTGVQPQIEQGSTDLFGGGGIPVVATAASWREVAALLRDMKGLVQQVEDE